LFAGQTWRISPEPFTLAPEIVEQLNGLGRVLLQFYRAVDLLYRQSVVGKQPAWISELLDRGKPPELIHLQRAPAFKGQVPRVIRPDVLLTETALSITELDSVPGGIGLTAWLNETYTAAMNSGAKIIGGADGMLRGFESIFGGAGCIHIVVSNEAETYRPEMQWMKERLGARFNVVDANFTEARAGDAVYRFFELFDMANVPGAPALFAAASEGQIQVTPPPKMIFEEKLLFALLWNRNLREFWRQQLGESFFKQLLTLIPYSWAVDPAPLPPHAAIPELNLTSWEQLKGLSQRERELILKISGFSPQAWGARGVYLGNDLSQAEWSAAVDKAVAGFESSPYVLQRYHKPATLPARYFDFEANEVIAMPGRVRLCPYYFVSGEGDQARANLGGVLATICPADKKIIHGMPDAILAPCSFRASDDRA
ncbi:MAG TPA: hypothetical protein VK530_10675, partial [Candidatus Acidoferrum sp.]|nr:hypothetical protein [Candidatus Acidoferrum sp.]